MLGDKAHLARGLPRLVDHEIGHDAALLGERIGQHQTRIIVADQRDKNAAGAKGGDIARHIAGAADLNFAMPDREHRRRRFGRYAGDVAIDEFIEHEIADAENRLPADELQRLLEVEHDYLPLPRS